MTLTEEQRAAIKIAIRYIPCWPSACKELHARGVLQAMIDSSEHVTDHTKMIGFDLKAARAICDHCYAPFSEVTDEHVSHAMQSFYESLAEIERLRASLVEHEEHENQTHKVLGNILGTDDTLENVAKRAAARIKELEAQCEDLMQNCNSLRERAWKAEVRIKEQDDALVENLAADIAYDDRLLWSRLDGQRQDEYREKARQQLQAGGKIGSGGGA